MTLTWPFGLQEGEWSWRSFTAGDYASKTVITVYCSDCSGLQHWVVLDWADFDGRADVGRGDAEDTATLICAAVNEYKVNHPEFKSR